MATTNIELDIENITGVSDANDQFIISAQKFVVSSVPKNLLHFAQKASSASTDGSAISFSVNDSITDVQRNGYSCKEISMSESIWALDSTSLKYATAKHPSWYHKQGAVHFAPVTDGSNTGYVFYVDYSLIDDDCDLRNAVIFHACAKEFTQLATSAIPTWSDVAVPIAPTTPDFGSDLSVSSTGPVSPSSPSFDTGAISVSSSAPTYSKPVFSAPSLGSVGSLTLPSVPAVPVLTTTTVSFTTTAPAYTKPSTTINAVLPGVPTISTVSFTDPGLSITAVEPAAVSLKTVNYSDATQTSVASLTPPLFTATRVDMSIVSFEDFWEAEEDSNPFGDNDPGAFSISAVPPTPPSDPEIRYQGSFLSDAISAAQDSIAAAVDSITVGPSDAAGTTDTLAPTDAQGANYAAYTKPTVGGSADELTDMTSLDDDNTIDVLADQPEFDQWFATAAHLIEDEEDTELAMVQIQKIQTYISAFQAEVQSANSTMQATIEDARNATQASIANASNDVSTNNTSMQTLVQASIANAGNDVQASISKMQNSTSAATTKMVQSTGAAIQKMQLSTSVNIENAAKTMDALVQDYKLGMQRYEANLSKYQQEITKEIQEYGQKLARYQLEVGVAYTAWLETQNYKIKKFQAQLGFDQAEYQSKATEFQGDLQKKLSDAQDANKIAMQNASQEAKDAIENNNAAIAKYTSESQNYSANIQKGIQSYTTELQSATQTMQATINDNQSKMVKYGNEIKAHDSQVQREIATIQSDLQNELNEFNKEMAEYQAQLQVSLKNADLSDANDTKSLEKYNAELNSYQAESNNAIQKWMQEEWTQNFLKYQNDYASLLQTYQADIQSELNEFNKEQAVFQNELQEKIQEATNQQNKDAQEYSAKLQKYANELQSYQADVNKEVQDYTNTLSKEVQEYQSKVGLYTADLQKYQAEVASETQKTGLNSQKAQVYAAEANKYYQWAVAEVQSYVQNNSKMIGMQMASQSQQQR